MNVLKKIAGSIRDVAMWVVRFFANRGGTSGDILKVIGGIAIVVFIGSFVADILFWGASKAVNKILGHPQKTVEAPKKPAPAPPAPTPKPESRKKYLAEEEASAPSSRRAHKPVADEKDFSSPAPEASYVLTKEAARELAKQLAKEAKKEAATPKSERMKETAAAEEETVERQSPASYDRYRIGNKQFDRYWNYQKRASR